MQVIEVFAEVACPFTHVSLRRFVAERSARGLSEPRLRIRAWPLELVNGSPLTGSHVGLEVDALRAQVEPGLFGGFDPDAFPSSSLSVFAAEAAAQALGPEVGEDFSLEVRSLLFDRGIDPSEPSVLEALLEGHGVDPATMDPDAAHASWQEGVALGVAGSPYFVVADRGWFCPSLEISHEETVYDVRYNTKALDEFFGAVFEGPDGVVSTLGNLT